MYQSETIEAVLILGQTNLIPLKYSVHTVKQMNEEFPIWRKIFDQKINIKIILKDIWKTDLTLKDLFLNTERKYLKLCFS